MMIKNIFPLLCALILAVPAGAAVVAPSAGAHAWISPVAELFSSIGAERIATLGCPSLTALSTLDSHASYPFAAAPQVLDLLAQNLRFYATPEAFASMGIEDKLIVLRTSAKGAEIQAAEIADESLATAKSSALHPGSADRISGQVAQAEAVALYLDAPRREEAARMRSKVARFQTKWLKHVEKFWEALPRRIAAGAFDAGNILVKTRHGWVAADESPYPVEADLSKFYRRRIEALKKAPQGPWIIQEASPLLSALGRPEIGGEKSWSVPAAFELAEIISSADSSDRALRSAADAFAANERYGRSVAPRHILAVEKRSADILNFPMMPTSIYFRIRDAIRNGAGGLPSWDKFREIERSTVGRQRRTTMIAMGVFFAGLIAVGLLGTAAGVSSWPPAAKLVTISIAWVAPMILFVRGLWLTGKLETARDLSYVSELLRRSFPND
ncbi:MAG TPA: hypothetical protein DCZ01_12765 [Elusimicrobia bacterium]|nr:MAG: hypothetical protein A2X37_12115 [Elusimicrobia bacterium GWA2_66_18]OGR72149.1 MAG: hypothetical protein A2X40_11495 [Elusimicrobia bacterium GWC2_65_9]HAZ09358.1 hypothetical protein [Elusimicrobiota bacterium]